MKKRKDVGLKWNNVQLKMRKVGRFCKYLAEKINTI